MKYIFVLHCINIIFSVLRLIIATASTTSLISDAPDAIRIGISYSEALSNIACQLRSPEPIFIAGTFGAI